MVPTEAKQNPIQYCWRFFAEYCIKNGALTPLADYGYIISKSDDAETVCKQLYEQLGEGYKIHELELRSDNVIIVE